jgi:RNase P subunit RPR2
MSSRQRSRSRSIRRVSEAELKRNLDDEEEKMLPQQAAGRNFEQEVDTNVFCINMSTLKREGLEMVVSGDPIFCKMCSAAFNMYSNVEETKKDGRLSQTWTCEFCNFKNNVQIDKEEVPKTSEANYILDANAH